MDPVIVHQMFTIAEPNASCSLNSGVPIIALQC